MMFTPEKPPIAEHPIWLEVRGWIYPQADSKNKSRYPLRTDTPRELINRVEQVIVPCVCGQDQHPFRRDKGKDIPSMFLTGREHRVLGCPSRPLVRLWGQWMKIELGKVHGVVQDSLYS